MTYEYGKCFSHCKNTARENSRIKKFDELKNACWVSSEKAASLLIDLAEKLPKEINEKHNVDIENILYELAKIQVAAE